MRQLFPSCLALLCLLFITSCTKEDPNAVKKVIEDYTIDDQKSIGANLVESIRANPLQYDVLNANAYSEVSDYLNTIFRSVVLTEQIYFRDEFDWELIPIIDNTNAYVYAMPGGKVVISTGMLQFLHDESELIALLAHEIYYTDRDKLSSFLGDEFGGDRMGTIALGKDEDSSDIIAFLKDVTCLKADVLAADMNTLELMCPFNYSLASLESLVNRAETDSKAAPWATQRPREETWTAEVNTQSNSCDSAEGETFQSRYESIKALLPE